MTKTKAMRLPISASIEQIEAKKAAAVSRLSPTEGAKPASRADLQRALAVHNSIHVQVKGDGMKGVQIGQDFDDARLELPVMQIQFYDKNPRTEANPEFETIKSSIAEKGRIENPLSVTRRPGTTQYMLYAGGNTRLQAIQELFRETQDERFRITTCNYRDWKSESDVLAGHLIENEVRGAMCFWDKAKGVSDLKLNIEKELGYKLSQREFEEHSKTVGLPIGKTQLTYYAFAVEFLESLGTRLSVPFIKEIQPQFNLSRRALTRFGFQAFAQTQPLVDGVAQYAKQLEVTDVIDISVLVESMDVYASQTSGMELAEWKQFKTLVSENPELDSLQIRALMRAPVVAPEVGVQLNAFESIAPAIPPIVDSSTKLVSPELQAAVTASSFQTIQPTGQPSDQLQEPPALQRQLSTAIGVVSTKSLVDVFADKRKAFTRRCEDFGRATGVQHLMIGAPAMPLGFYIEIPTAPLDLELSESDAGNAGNVKVMSWWLLAYMTGQRDKDIALEGIDPAMRSEWRRLIAEGPDVQIGELEVQLQHYLGANTELVEMGAWMDRANPVSRLGAPLIVSYHELLDLRDQIQKTETAAGVLDV